jgi:hypothetical protein
VLIGLSWHSSSRTFHVHPLAPVHCILSTYTCLPMLFYCRHHMYMSFKVVKARKQ